MDIKKLRGTLITTVVEQWALQHQFEFFTESLVVNTLTRLLNDTFAFTIFVVMNDSRSFDVHYESDKLIELQIINFNVNHEN